MEEQRGKTEETKRFSQHMIHCGKTLHNFKRLSNIYKNTVIGLSKARHEGKHHVISMIREMCN